MGIKLLDEIVTQSESSDYALVDDKYIRGSLKAVTYYSELADIPLSRLKDKCLAMVAQPTPTLYIYDLASNTWSLFSSNSGDGGAAVYDDVISEIYTWSSQKINSELENKVDKEDGKGLSTNDLTDELLEKINTPIETHTHDNKEVIDKLTESDDGKLVFDGTELGAKVYTSLAELGLTADATLDDVITTMPKGSSAILSVTEFTNAQTMFPYEEGNDYTFGRVYIVKGSDNGRIYAKWFRKDGVKEYTAKIDITTNAIIGWNKQNTYTSLSQLGLTADATVNDIIAKLSAGESALINVAEFNDKTQFPDTSSSNNMATVSVRKTNEIGRTVVEWFKKDGRYAVAVLDGTNKVSDWREYAVETKKGLAQNSQYYKIDITKKGNKYRNGVVRFSYNNGSMPCEVAIFLSYGDSTGHIGYYTYTYGTNCIQSITLTGDDTNVVIGIELTKTVYGTQLVEVNDSFCTINSLNAEQFTGDAIATYNDSSNEILHTGLSGNLANITTVLDLVNALVTEYRALSPKKPIRFVSGDITKTTLTDLPRNYGLLQITVSGYDVVDVSFAGSSFGFKTLHYGFVNRTSGETLFSSLFWEIVDTPVTELIDLGLDGSATIQNVMDAMTIGQHCILNTSRFDDKTEVNNIEYGKVEIRRLSSGMWSLWLEDVLHGSTVAHGTCSASKFAGWHYFVTKDYVDSKIADLQAQINALK